MLAKKCRHSIVHLLHGVRGLGSRSNAQFTATNKDFGSKNDVFTSCNVPRNGFGQNLVGIAKWPWTYKN